jgi:hypothetical protein
VAPREPAIKRARQCGPVLTLARARLDHLVDEAVLLGFAGRDEAVALGVQRDLLDRLAGVFGEDLVETSRMRRISFAWISMSVA